jgi:hypothetical protein
MISITYEAHFFIGNDLVTILDLLILRLLKKGFKALVPYLAYFFVVFVSDLTPFHRSRLCESIFRATWRDE